MRRWLAVLVVLLAGCGSEPGAAPSTSPTAAPSAAAASARNPALDGQPLVADIRVGASDHIFAGGDDHVTIVVTNRGRDILHFAFVEPLWVDEHSLAMGATAACMPDPAAGLVDCGPVYAGQTARFLLRAMPADEGVFDYRARFFDRRDDGSMAPIGSPADPGTQVTATFRETVTAQGRQVPGYYATPAT